MYNFMLKFLAVFEKLSKNTSGLPKVVLHEQSVYSGSAVIEKCV